MKKISSIREFIVLNDAFLNNTVASIRQQILYIDTLYPFLYVLVAVAALIESYLMVVSRKKEFATMRGLGTTRIRSFFSFFAEQGFLCLLGTAIGLMIWMLAAGFPGTLHLVLIAGFVLCYSLGSAISVTVMNHTNVLTILTDRD